jgi:hypothetical protein
MERKNCKSDCNAREAMNTYLVRSTYRRSHKICHNEPRDCNGRSVGLRGPLKSEHITIKLKSTSFAEYTSTDCK